MVWDTQAKVNKWQHETFGDHDKSPGPIVDKFEEEVNELVDAVMAGDLYDIQTELADVVIILCRIADRYSIDIEKAVLIKLAINQKRIWKQDEGGTFSHIEHLQLVEPCPVCDGSGRILDIHSFGIQHRIMQLAKRDYSQSEIYDILGIKKTDLPPREETCFLCEGRGKVLTREGEQVLEALKVAGING